MSPSIARAWRERSREQASGSDRPALAACGQAPVASRSSSRGQLYMLGGAGDGKPLLKAIPAACRCYGIELLHAGCDRPDRKR